MTALEHVSGGDVGAGEGRASARMPARVSDQLPAPLDLPAVLDAIAEVNLQRRFAGEQIRRIDNGCRAAIDRLIGSYPARREGKARRDELIRARERGEPSDDPMATIAAPIVTASQAARAPFESMVKVTDRALRRLAARLPAASWVQRTPGCSLLGLALIVGEAGDLNNYPTRSHLQKRLGLAVLDGVRQGGLGKGAAKADWIRHGYSRRRRALMWNLGASLLRSGNAHYRAIYDRRKAYEVERAQAAGLEVIPAAEITKANAGRAMSLGHVHARAMRVMTKAFVRDLWRAWRAAARGDAT